MDRPGEAGAAGAPPSGGGHLATHLTVGDVLEYYHQHVVPSVSAALIFFGKFPKEILNEIRNAFTHIARANAMMGQGTVPEAEKELEAAIRHLRRVCLDCLKIAILTVAKQTERAIRSLSGEMHLPNDVYSVSSNLRRQRHALSTHEGQEPPQQVIEELTGLLDDYDKFYASLDKHYAGGHATVRRWARRWRAFIGLVVGFILGIVSSIVADNIKWPSASSGPAASNPAVAPAPVAETP